MAAHGQAVDAVKTMRLYRYFAGLRNYTVDVSGYNGSQARKIQVYKFFDLAFRKNPKPVAETTVYKFKEISQPNSVLPELLDMQSKVGGKVLTGDEFTRSERALINSFERPDNTHCNDAGLFEKMSKLR